MLKREEEEVERGEVMIYDVFHDIKDVLMHKMNDACRKSKSKASRIHREAAAAVISLCHMTYLQ